MTVLKIKSLSAGYGDIQVLREINFSIKKGETVALLGANASGKTTFINTLHKILGDYGLSTSIEAFLRKIHESYKSILKYLT